MNQVPSEFKSQALLLELICLITLLVNAPWCAIKTYLQSVTGIKEKSKNNIHKSISTDKSVYDFLRVYLNDAISYWVFIPSKIDERNISVEY